MRRDLTTRSIILEMRDRLSRPISPKLFELETSMLLLDVLLIGLLSTSGNHIRELQRTA